MSERLFTAATFAFESNPHCFSKIFILVLLHLQDCGIIVYMFRGKLELPGLTLLLENSYNCHSSCISKCVKCYGEFDNIDKIQYFNSSYSMRHS